MCGATGGFDGKQRQGGEGIQGEIGGGGDNKYAASSGGGNVVVAMNARRGLWRWWKRMWDEGIVCGASGSGGIGHSLRGGDGNARMMRCSAFIFGCRGSVELNRLPK